MIMGEGDVGSHNVDIILGGRLLNDDAWLQRGERVHVIGGELCNNK